MTFLQNLKVWLLCLVVGLTLGGAVVYGGQKAWHTWVQGAQTTRSAKTSGKNIINARQGSDKIEDRVAKGNAKAAAVRQAAARHMQEQANAQEQARQYAKNHPTEAPHEAQTVDPNALLDLGTVRLLNDARSGTAPGAPASGDAAGASPSDVAVGDLVDADIDAAARYNELMERHNALVDWVDSVLKHQASHP